MSTTLSSCSTSRSSFEIHVVELDPVFWCCTAALFLPCSHIYLRALSPPSLRYLLWSAKSPSRLTMLTFESSCPGLWFTFGRSQTDHRRVVFYLCFYYLQLTFKEVEVFGKCDFHFWFYHSWNFSFQREKNLWFQGFRDSVSIFGLADLGEDVSARVSITVWLIQGISICSDSLPFTQM